MTATHAPETQRTPDLFAHSPKVRSWSILILLCVAQFSNVFHFQSVTLILPAIQRDLDFSTAHLQWVVNANVLAFGGGLLVAGRLADLSGHRRLFIFGLALCTLASLASGLAISPLMLILARIAQGISSAMMIPAALALLMDTFPQETDRHRALGIWSAAGPVGGIVGTVLGTILADTFGWPWIFFLNVPIMALALLVALTLLPDVRKTVSSVNVDFAGAFLSTGSVVLLIAGLTQIVRPTENGLILLALFAGSLVFLLLFYLLERRIAHPLLPLRIFFRPGVASASLVTLIYSAATNTPIFFFTLYMQQVRGFSAFITGLAFLPTNLALIGGSCLCARLIKWLGSKNVILGSLLLIAIAALLLIDISISGEYAWTLLPGLILLGGGLGLAQVVVTAVGLAQVPIDERGLASSLVTTASQVGTAVGLAILVSLANLRSTVLTGHPQPSSTELVAGFQWAFAGGAIFAVLSILTTIFMMKKANNQ
jgi:MFS family permease